MPSPPARNAPGLPPALPPATLRDMTDPQIIGDFVTIARDAGVATVTLKRGHRLNPLSRQALDELRRAAQALRSDTSVHAIILTGDPVFSAGADLKDAATRSTEDTPLLEKRERMRAGPDACDAWEALDQVTIAAIEGFAIGGGVALAVACDFRVMGAGAYLRLPEIPLGMNMSWHSVPRLVALGGPARTKTLTLFGDNMPAAEALAAGFADQVVPDGTVLAAATALARKAAALPPVAARIAKRAITASASALHGATSYADLDQFALTASSGDNREAVTAFLERRTPTFTGS
ncbi:Short-chain-enoyl-CoA hydratase [Alphaproteobacteria bacterium SO-S41]|nr:Short-chain-enoyl-CoA hydratase [Alphaproteobacteria bacterium SO-S41]